MLDRLIEKVSDDAEVAVVKASVEDLEAISSESFDAVTMVNVIYALDDPFGCLQQINRILRPGGRIGISTTHRETSLDRLLNEIEVDVERRCASLDSEAASRMRSDFELVERINKEIQRTIARRHTRHDYTSFVKDAGFEITHLENSTYLDAVMLIHARKRP